MGENVLGFNRLNIKPKKKAFNQITTESFFVFFITVNPIIVSIPKIMGLKDKRM